ncbi:uncharacterized protein IUM83_12992 [Phytophthora cinnamomi]|uniref:uncharacterized protein n=1 Tax=Phytophthora cinnamomi TaxID=4785 RepID=UPI003559DD3B|nr:hypothetical protein IUM83_12992 [Phytophthora cinnamomi]
MRRVKRRVSRSLSPGGEAGEGSSGARGTGSLRAEEEVTGESPAVSSAAAGADARSTERHMEQQVPEPGVPSVENAVEKGISTNPRRRSKFGEGEGEKG